MSNVKTNTETNENHASRDLSEAPCSVCGDIWKWPNTDQCYSCTEEAAYQGERSHVSVHGEDSACLYVHDFHSQNKQLNAEE